MLVKLGLFRHTEGQLSPFIVCKMLKLSDFALSLIKAYFFSDMPHIVVSPRNLLKTCLLLHIVLLAQAQA